MKKRDYVRNRFPASRIATFDIGAISRKKHYVTALLEFNVTDIRNRIKTTSRNRGAPISFTAWMLKVIGDTVYRHRDVAAFLSGRRTVAIFNDVDISIIVEKELAGAKVPLPLVIRKVHEKSAEAIAAEVERAKTEDLSPERIVLDRKTGRGERIYYFLPGTVRRWVWRTMLRHPRFVFRRMGNVAVTSLGAMGSVSGWFIQTAVHPLSFGIGSIVRKPIAVGDQVGIGEILHVTMLLDHDAVDGAPMARFVRSLKNNIEGGLGLDEPDLAGRPTSD